MVQEQFTVIAIDGKASSGKGTVGKAVASRNGFYYLDTGKHYRLVAWFVEQKAQQLGVLADSLIHDSPQLERILSTLTIHELFSPYPSILGSEAIGVAASSLAQLRLVRERLVVLQQSMIQQVRSEGRYAGIVVDGRDIASAVCPHANLKLYFTADLSVRATRRAKELFERGDFVSFEVAFKEVQQLMALRDSVDATRAINPDKPVADAIIIDTTHQTVEAVVNHIQSCIEGLES